MAEQTILTWNMTNWITVLVMVALGFFIIGLGAQVLRNRKGDQAA